MPYISWILQLLRWNTVTSSSYFLFSFLTPLLCFTTTQDRFWVGIHSAHVLISITFAIFEYLNLVLPTENKILTFSRAVLPYKIRSSNVNLALILLFHGHKSWKRATWKKEGMAMPSILWLKGAWLISWVMTSYVLRWFAWVIQNCFLQTNSFIIW